MLQPDAVARLKLLMDTARVPVAADTSRVRKVSGMVPGENVAGRVERELPNGAFHVVLRGKTFEMKLPNGFKPDHNIQLRYLGDQPRPTFLLLNTLPGTSEDKLSQLGKLITTLLAPQSETATRAAAQRVSTIISDDPENTLKMPVFLRNALTQSGLFYESHQAQWVAGRMALEQLLKEPQARLNSTSQSNPTAHQGHRDATHQEAKPLPTSSLNPAPTERVALADLRSSDLHADSIPIVRQQLESLDSRHVAWRGEAWPDQFMEWETGQEDAAGGTDEQAAWYSTIKLDLPNLGSVRVRAVLAGTSARISVEYADSESGPQLQGAQAVLAEQLHSRGIGLAEFKVANRETDV